ncbi:PAS domain S-box protein [Candidatus Woesearchaeota archaeon]|nr:PAS domain S-box protein [Candidatus Woesearchaeota archaeon]
MYERLFKHNIMPLFISDKSGRIIAFNTKFTEIVGYEKNKILNRNFSEIFHPETEEEKQKFSLIEFGFFKESDAHDVVLVTKKGTKRYVRLWIDAMFDDELSLAAVEDYTEKRLMELKLAEQNQELKKMKDQLQDFNKKLEAKVNERTSQLLKANEEIKLLLERKNQFINELAHDLRTPLTPITYLVQSMKEEIKSKSILKDMEVIENNANYLKNLVEDILKLARIDNNKIEFNFEDSSMYDITQNIIKNNKITFKKLKLNFVNKVSKNTPTVHIDRLKITEVLENLVMNSTKFMKKGGTMTFSAKETGNFLQFTVKDNGQGIGKDHIDKIFEEFYKADSSRHHKGSGLGLSICRRIIEKHEGKIWAESPGIGKGTSIIFTLKLSKSVSEKDKKPAKQDHKDVDKEYIEKLERIKNKLTKIKKKK